MKLNPETVGRNDHYRIATGPRYSRNGKAPATPRLLRVEKLPQMCRKEEARLELLASLKDAREQEIYWTEKRALAELRAERAICGARALAWSMTVKALLEKINGKGAAA